jgi:hypothetical protein
MKKNQIKEFENMTEEQMHEKKLWLFRENMRLEELGKTLEDERKLIEVQKGLLEKQQSRSMLLRRQLESQKILFDQQWQLLEAETRRLAVDKEQFERNKAKMRDKAFRDARKSMDIAANVSVFFKGVNDTESLRKRYKALQKIYHPDNMHGDSALITAINEEYEKLKRFYLGT